MCYSVRSLFCKFHILPVVYCKQVLHTVKLKFFVLCYTPTDKRFFKKFVHCPQNLALLQCFWNGLLTQFNWAIFGPSDGFCSVVSTTVLFV